MPPVLPAPALWLLPALPLLGFLLNGALSLVPAWRDPSAPVTPARRTTVAAIGVGVMVAAFVVGVLLVLQVAADPAGLRATLGTWMAAGDLRVDWTLALDRLSAVMVLVITGIGTLIHLYSAGYMASDAGYARYFAYLNLFVAFMLVLVLGASLPVLFVGWEGVGLASYLLIGFWFSETANAVAGKKAFVTNRIGDFGLLIGMFLLFANLGTLDIAEIVARHGELPVAVATAACLFLFLGCAGKSAQLPLYVWLPDAMAGPTPVSALIHAATMVTAGIYLVVRMGALFAAAPVASLVVMVVGAVTAIWAGLVGLKQWDIKKVLAYSTVSQLGYMFMAAGAGAYTAAMFHLVTHAFFKALLFLGAGAVIHAMHDALHHAHVDADAQDLRNMGGLARRLPVTNALMWIATLAIAGVPPLAGFFSKDAILGSLAARAGAADAPIAQASLLGVPGSVWLWFAYGIGVVTAFVTAVYMTRLMRYAFTGTFRSGDAAEAALHESPWSMRLPLLVLGALTLVGGWLELPAVLPIGPVEQLGHWLAPVVEAPMATLARGAHLEHATEYVLIGVAVAVALAGIATAFVLLKPAALVTKVESAPEQGIGRVLANDYFIDAAIARGVTGPIVATSRKVLWRGLDEGLLRGALTSGSAHALRIVSWVGGQLQAGVAGGYAWAIAGGALALVAFLMFRGA
ncbi:MAG: NADH-quinone oxidoreductase subunit L [Gemmatimonadaceae bacterium]|nr:NADH-quinone oxidoreductase subunit L [Gemmatimonadaceae bacterium]